MPEEQKDIFPGLAAFKPEPKAVDPNKELSSQDKTDTDEHGATLEFHNMDEVETAFKKGALQWPKFLMVDGLKYVYMRSYHQELIEVLLGNKKAHVIYHLARQSMEEAKKKDMGLWMVFLFRSETPTSITPDSVGFTSSYRGKPIYKESEELTEEKQVIGDVVLMKISLPSGIIALKGKVDTGAEISSLHCDGKPKVIGETVRFKNRNASGSTITAPLVCQQAVKSADGGVEYRPVIELDIEINGKNISKAQFNLNDRSHMEHEILIGQNILEKGGFLVDPSMHKDEDTACESEEYPELTDEEFEEMLEGYIASLEEDIENTDED